MKPARIGRFLGLFRAALVGAAIAASFPAAPASAFAPQPPRLLLPRDGSTQVDPRDLHFTLSPFEDGPLARHTRTVVEITDGTGTTIWRFSGGGRSHVHLDEGRFIVTGVTALRYGATYRARGEYGNDAGDMSGFGPASIFTTRDAPDPEPLSLSEVSSDLAWRNDAGDPITPDPAAGVVLRLETAAGRLAELRASGPIYYPATASAAPLRVRVAASGALDAPAGQLEFLAESNRRVTIRLPALHFPSGGSCSFWIDGQGQSWAGSAEDTEPRWDERLAAAVAPWWKAPGFQVDRIASGINLPVNIAFVPEPGSEPDAPIAYVTQLHDGVSVLLRDGTARVLAHSMLNYDPGSDFPGSAETGVIGIAVEPDSGDLFLGMVYQTPEPFAFPFNRLVRLDTRDGGRTAGDTTILFQGIPSAPAHQIEFVTIGPDGKLYVGVGDGMTPAAALNTSDRRGKILRVERNGSIPADNPIPGNPVFASGVRNPFGGTFRPGTDQLYISDNGPARNDRLARIVAGGDYGWNGTASSLTRGAIFRWDTTSVMTGPVTVAPTAIAFAPPGVFPGRDGHLFVALSGPTYLAGPTTRGKSIVEFTLDAEGAVIDTATVVSYSGTGRGTVCGLAFGPGGLYWTDLYGEEGFDEGLTTGGTIYRLSLEAAPLAPPCATELPVSGGALRLARNPGAGTVAFRIETEGALPFEAALFDVAGRLVARMAPATVPAGVTEQALGDGLPPGIYLYKARVGDEAFKGKAVLMR